MTSAKSYFRVLLHWWKENGEVTGVEVIDHTLFACECRYPRDEEGLCPSDEAVYSDFMAEVSVGDFANDLLANEVVTDEGYIEAAGEVTVIWKRDIDGNIDTDDIEFDVKEKYIVSEKMIRRDHPELFKKEKK